MAKHSEKMGRWGTEVAKATDSHEYFVLMEISHASREPLNHILLHLQKKLRDDELRTGTTRLSSLVCTELEEITEEYVGLFNDPKWDPDGDLVQGLVGIWPDQFFAGLVTLLTNSYCEYDHRFLDRLGRFPFNALFLVESPAAVRALCGTIRTSCSTVAAPK